MLSDLKVKTEGTSTSAARTISRNGKENVFEENTDSDSLSSVSTKKIFEDGLPEIKRFVGKPIPVSFTKNWNSKPTPPDMQFEERPFQTQFSLNNNNYGHSEIVELLVTGFTGTLYGWWDSYLTEESRDSIKSAVKKNDEGFPIFDENQGRGIPDGVNTLIYTILKHFVGTPSNVSSRISDYLNNLRCLAMSDYKWYQGVFLSRVMLQKDCYKPYWKEKFIDGLPPIFAHKDSMDKLWRSNSFVSSRTTGFPPDIVNEQDHTVEENEIPDF
ncbi:hypothetical protein SO802_006078 [Lithocarpus litseifolius]|uniref:DUF7746 domain-containing protein n=1 Tax=Lithocarpus litseifolius TaxID=425828 RepID=A0AAW2DNT7_9ROSI